MHQHARAFSVLASVFLVPFVVKLIRATMSGRKGKDESPCDHESDEDRKELDDFDNAEAASTRPLDDVFATDFDVGEDEEFFAEWLEPYMLLSTGRFSEKRGADLKLHPKRTIGEIIAILERHARVGTNECAIETLDCRQVDRGLFDAYVASGYQAAPTIRRERASTRRSHSIQDSQHRVDASVVAQEGQPARRHARAFVSRLEAC